MLFYDNENSIAVLFIIIILSLEFSDSIDIIMILFVWVWAADGLTDAAFYYQADVVRALRRPRRCRATHRRQWPTDAPTETCAHIYILHAPLLPRPQWVAHIIIT